jgi:hypothetical protein
MGKSLSADNPMDADEEEGKRTNDREQEVYGSMK